MSETIDFICQGYEAWPILVTSDHPTAHFAADELQSYLTKIADRPVRIIASPSQTQSPYIELTFEDGASAGFVRRVSPTGIQIIGRSPHGLLCGVYDLLEELGCHWYSPGTLGERIQKAHGASLPAGIKDVEPYLPRRALALGHPEYLADALDWIDWAGKNRFDAVYFRPYAGHGDDGERAWNEVRKGALVELEKRGMQAEFGGHCLSRLLPRRLFWRHKRAFRFHGRRRTPDHNLCPSSPEALELLRKRATRFFRANQGIRLFHIWPDDVPGGGWCECASCRQLSPADQALLVINALAEALATVDAEACIAFPAYHDTIAAPVSARPASNVIPVFAPRDRCYAHTLDDERCPLNHDEYLPQLHAQSHWFSSADIDEAYALEFYLDGALFNSAWPPLANMLGGDIVAHVRAGCRQVTAMADGNRPWLRLPLSATLFARLSWDPSADVQALVRQYATAYFGGPPETLVEYLANLNAAWELLLDLTPQDAVIAEPPKGAPMPHHEALDFAESPLEARRAKLAALQQARRHIEHARDLLEVASRPGAGTKPRGRVTRSEVLDREAKELELTEHIFEWFYQRQLAYCLLGENAPRREVNTAMAKAGAELVHISRWGHRELKGNKGWLRAFHSMCMRWQLDLYKLEHDLARSPLSRLFRRSQIRRGVSRLEK